MSEERLLDQIESPDQVSGLSRKELDGLCQELREEIIGVVSAQGGHLGASLGVVELTVALHHCFDSPRDKIVWDVGHQAYGHKILTGRRDGFSTLRQMHGLSGFPKRGESVHDTFGVGHASTSISAALGYAIARDLRKERHHVLAVIGDGALTGGIAYEGLNNAGEANSDLIVILNDNEMSISPNVGAINRYLTQMTTGQVYNKIEGEIWELLGKMPGGDKAQKLAHRIKESLKSLMTPGQLFEALGFRYFGPIDGHNLNLLVDTLNQVKQLSGPTLIHLITQKGKGYEFAENDPAKYHGVSCFNKEEGVVSAPVTTGARSYTEIFGDTLVQLASEDRRLVAITAAMPDGTGLISFSEKYPERFFDVGIAEAHAVTFAAALACRGLKPVVAIYSTFLQRAFDQVIHDVALQKLNVIFALDRAGLVGADGPTHHGCFDLAYLRSVPNLVIMAPKDEGEFQNMLKTAAEYDDGPIVLRYPRGKAMEGTLSPSMQQIPLGKGEILQEGKDILLIGIGTGVQMAVESARKLESEGLHPTILNARFAKPLDEELILQQAHLHSLICTFEEGTIRGGFGSAVLEILHEAGNTPGAIHNFGIPDDFVEHGTRDELMEEIHLDPESTAQEISQLWKSLPRRVDLSEHRRMRGA